MSDSRRLRNFVDGAYVDTKDGSYADVIDPTIGAPFASAPVSGPVDVDVAMSAAATAFESWRDTTPSERQRALLKIADSLDANADELGRLQDQIDAQNLREGVAEGHSGHHAG